MSKIDRKITRAMRRRIAKLKRDARRSKQSAKRAARAVREAKRIKAIHELKFGASLRS